MSKIKNKVIEKINNEPIRIKLTKKQIEIVGKKKITVKDGKMFMHCRHCMKEYEKGKFGRGLSPKEAMTYCVASVPFKYTKKESANIIGIFCNRCGRPVWDSRHLTHLY